MSTPTSTGSATDVSEPGDDGQAQESSSSALHVVVIGLALLAVLIAGIVALLATKHARTLHPGQPVPGEGRTFDLLSGVPQHGFILGDVEAPVTLVEFADLHCSTCAEFANDALPELVREYVLHGELRVVFRPLDNSPDSLRGAQIAAALALQDRMWQFVGLSYHNQESATAPFFDENYIASLIEAIPGAQLGPALGARGSSRIAGEVARFATEAHRAGLGASPSFVISRTGAPGRPFKPTSLVDGASFATAIERLLERRA
ncbi:MAG: DsbA family protein [Solirubrobacteraceae bacterium]